MPATALLAATSRTAVRIVEFARARGTAASALLADRFAVISPADGARPLRSNRPRNRSRPREPALKRSQRPAELSGRLLLGEALHAAEHDSGAKLFGKPGELFVNDRTDVIGVLDRRPRPQSARPSVARAAGGGSRPARRLGYPLGHLMEPGTQRVADPERVSPANQHHECRLKRVFHGLLVAQNCSTGAQNHRAVPRDQGSKCQLGAISGAASKLFEQLPVSQAANRADLEKHSDMPEAAPCSPRNMLGSPRVAFRITIR